MIEVVVYKNGVPLSKARVVVQFNGWTNLGQVPAKKTDYNGSASWDREPFYDGTIFVDGKTMKTGRIEEVNNIFM